MSVQPSAGVGEAFRRLQAGNAAGALELARRIAAAEPANAHARLAEGIALRMMGRLEESRGALERAAQLDPASHAAAYELGVALRLQGDGEAALRLFERARALRPDFFAAHFAAGALRLDRGEWAEAAERFGAVLQLRPADVPALLHLAWAFRGAGRHAQAEDAYVRALCAGPDDFATLKSFGQYSASRGRFARAAKLFTEASRQRPDDEALPMFVAQCELLEGRWAQAWAAYRRRDPRRRFERACAAANRPYRTPATGETAGRDVTLVAEQGLGDVLFFLRWAPRLREAGARLRFAGHARLHSILSRSGLFEGFAQDDSPAGAGLPLLVGDLPALFPDADPLAFRSLRIGPLPARVAAWREALEAAGPRPWIGATWRAGTPPEVVAYALSKTVPLEALFAALGDAGGTVFAFQRGIGEGELAAAGRALGRPVHDLSAAAEDPEDALAVAALLDRHAGVSSTNMHLAALAGATADVLAPFPPEWRWRAEGQSPWFPGFRVHRQSVDGDWGAALEALRASLAR